jgi:hypothetical protein
VTEERVSVEEFGRAFKRFLDWALEEVETEEAGFAKLLREHFGQDPATFPITTERFGPYERPNLQLALESYLGEADRTHELVGFSGAHEMMDISLASVVGTESGFLHVGAGPVQRTVVELDEGKALPCVTSGLFLIRDGETRLAVRVGGREGPFGGNMIELEAMTGEAESGEDFLAEIRRRMDEHNVYRGKMFALSGGDHSPEEAMAVGFLARPHTEREDIVLPDGLLDQIELHTVEFARVRETLAAGGRHLRRGLLLHGAPGTGKTLTAGYLAARMPDQTVLLLTGGGLGLVGPACAIARALQPAMVVLEDIDLVASERSMMGMGSNSLLFELLNEMDGIGEDADVTFLMTTNRVERLEPALASRPGRVDQAVEIPLPDAESRDRLLGLFSRGLDVQLADRSAVVERTDGASPAFLRELVRKAALRAAVAGDEVVDDGHFAAALDALEEGGALTRRILGAEGADEVDSDTGPFLELDEDFE